MASKVTRNIIYDIRKEKGMRSQDVASQLKIQTATLYRWEIGASVPTMTKLDMLADILGVERSVFNVIGKRCAREECNGRAYQDDLCKRHYFKRNANKLHMFITRDLASEKTLGGRIKHLRTKRSLTIDDFAKKFGVTNYTVVAWERDSIKPTLNMLVDIAGYFGVNTRFLERGIMDE